MGGQIIAVVNFNSLQTQNYLALRELHEQFSMGVQIIVVVNFNSSQTQNYLALRELHEQFSMWRADYCSCKFLFLTNTQNYLALRKFYRLPGVWFAGGHFGFCGAFPDRTGVCDFYRRRKV